MLEQLKTQIELLFEDAPKTRKAFDLKEEFIANAIDRYTDLVSDGISEEDAYKNVMNSIGDVNELFHSLDKEPVYNHQEIETRQKKSALITAFSVGMYILAAMFLVASYTFWGFEEAGLLVSMGICIIPTCLLVYNANAYPSYTKQEDTVVEDFKKWTSDAKKKKAVFHAISSVLWTFTILIYLVVSFVTMKWHLTWMIFIAAVCIETIITLIFKVKELDE